MDDSSSSSCDEFDDAGGLVVERKDRAAATTRSDKKRPSLPFRAGDGQGGPALARSAPAQSLLSRSVLHLDVDCFYCQCEELSDPTRTLSSRPLGIGQKHIIVTCNYAARRRGVKKLMLRTEAIRVCPDLVIREGSDLEPYRLQSRRIYAAFRDTVKALPGRDKNSAAKGGMDEFYCDITAAVDHVLGGVSNRRNAVEVGRVSVDPSSGEFPTSSAGDGMPPTPQTAFIYGDHSSSSVSISEDQSGAIARITNSSAARRPADGIPPSTFGGLALQSRLDIQPESVTLWGNEDERNNCVQRLLVAASFANRIKSAVHSGTGFSTCVGVSVSPLLSKIASDLQKPSSLNILYPWRSSNILENLPLRRIPGLGSRTLRALTPSLEKSCGSLLGKKKWWTCRDLLRVPRSTIVGALAKQDTKFSCGQLSDILLQRCQGIDPALIVDDDGGLPKTVSVEESFRRGSVTERSLVVSALEELFVRLSRLLDERKRCSGLPNRAFPKTLRLSVRLVDKDLNVKRPFVSSSKQCSFDGDTLLQMSDMDKRATLLRRVALPLLESLLPKRDSDPIDVTKLNIAATNFDDQSRQICSDQQSVSQFFAPATKGAEKKPPEARDWQPRISTDMSSRAAGIVTNCAKEQQPTRKGKQCSVRSFLSGKGDGTVKSAVTNDGSLIDPQVLSELPADIAAEIVESYKLNKTPKKTSCRDRGIDSFFIKKS